MYGDGFMKGIGTVMVVFGALIGLAFAYVLPWLWSLIKPWLHAITG